MADPYFAYRPLFNLLGKSEGTDKKRGYNETLGYGPYTGGDVNLIGMTLPEIAALQPKMLKHPNNKMGLLDSTLFNEKTQDHLCLYLLEGRGLSKYLDGSMKEATFINNLAKEWASIPTTSGKGYYDNQSRTPVTPDEVRKVLQEVKERI